jgi:predicted DNA-binding transcriptional regulator AlpA
MQRSASDSPRHSLSIPENSGTTSDEGCSDNLLSGYLRPEQAAQAIGLTRRTLDSMYARREGPPRTKVAGRIYYRKDALRRWLLDQEQAPARARRSREVTR